MQSGCNAGLTAEALLNIQTLVVKATRFFYIPAILKGYRGIVSKPRDGYGIL